MTRDRLGTIFVMLVMLTAVVLYIDILASQDEGQPPVFSCAPGEVYTVKECP